MRNLKKVLALVLALVMSLSLVTIANAADFSDAADINYDEAVDVMVAAGIIDGVGGNKFDPNGTLTREQAAKLITYMLMGENSDKLGVEGTSFKDVAVTRWSAPAIEYCATMGIIDGAGDGNFYPAGRLTGYAFAKMLLTALGYKSDREGFTGANWTINVATKAISEDVRLDKGLEKMFGSAELSRQEAAQMALNAIKAPLVEYDNDNTISVNGATVQINGGSAKFVTTTIAKQQNISDRRLTNTNENIQGGYTVEFGERYLSNLRLTKNDDDFDRPSHTWIYKSEEIGTYVDYENLVETFTVGVTGKDLYETLGSSTIKEYDTTYYVDGKVEEDIKPSNMIRTNTKEYGETGKGVLTQVFVDHDKKEITITSIHTYLAQAQSDYNAKKGTLSLKVYKTGGGVSKSVDVEDVPGIENYKKDDYVLVNWAEIGSGSGTYDKFEVVKVTDPEVSENQKLTKYAANKYLVSAGTQYDYGKDGTQKNELGAYDADGTKLKDFTYNLYFDQYGYVAGVVKYSGEDHYLFLTGYDRPRSNLTIKTANANAIFLDGTMEEITVNVTETDKKLTSDGSGDIGQEIDGTNYPLLKAATEGLPSYNKWFKYSVKGEGSDAVYTLTSIAAGSWMNVAHASFASRGINTASVRLTGTTPSGSPKAWGNDKSVFLTVEAKDAAVDGVDITGDGNVDADAAITKVKDVYTGMDDTDLTVYSSTDIETTYFVDSVFAVMDEDKYIIGAVVVGDAKNSNKNWAYALEETQAEWIDDDYTYWGFKAVVDGEIKDLTVKDKYGDTISKIQGVVGDANITESGLLKLTYDKEGYVVDATVYAVNTSTLESTTANKVYENKDWSSSIDVDPDTFDAYNVRFGTGSEKKLTGDGRTLYAADKDAGLRLEKDAPVVVIQIEEDSNSNKEVVYDVYSNLLEAREELVSDTAYRGWISAVIGDKGAKYIVLKEIRVKNVTTDDPSIGGDKSGTKEITLPTGLPSAANDKLIKSALANAAAKDDYEVAYRIPGVKPQGAPNTSDASHILYIPFKTATKDAEAILTIVDEDDNVVYAESSGTIASAGFHYFYVNTVSHVNPGGAGSMTTSGLAAGTYTWTVEADGETFTGTFKV